MIGQAQGMDHTQEKLGGDQDHLPTLSFENDTEYPCKVCWVADSGEEHTYKILEPGESYEQVSSRGETWRMRKIIRREVARFVVPSNREGKTKFVFFDSGEKGGEPIPPELNASTALSHVPLLDNLQVPADLLLPEPEPKTQGEIQAKSATNNLISQSGSGERALLGSRDENAVLDGASPGPNIFPLNGRLPLASSTEPMLAFVRDFFNLDHLSLQGSIENNDVTRSFALRTFIDQDITLIKSKYLILQIKGSMLSLLINGEPPEPTLRVDVLGELVLGDTQKQNIETNGSLIVQVESISAALTVSPRPEWKEPFGIPGLILRNLALEAGLTYAAPFVDNLGVLAELQLGDISGRVALKVDVNDPDQFALAGFISEMRFLDFIFSTLPLGWLVLEKIPENIKSSINTLLNIRFTDMRINVVPYPQTIGTVNLQQGLFFGGTLHLWSWRARFWIHCEYIEEMSLSLSAEFDTLSLFSGALKITASEMDVGQQWASPPLFLSPPDETATEVHAAPGESKQETEASWGFDDLEFPDGPRMYFHFNGGMSSDTGSELALPSTISPGQSSSPESAHPQNVNPVEFGFSARVQLLMMSADVYAELGDEGLEFDFDGGIPDLAEAQLHCIYRNGDFFATGHIRLSLFFSMMPLIAIPVVAGVPLLGRLIFNALGVEATLSMAMETQRAQRFALECHGALTVLGKKVTLSPVYLSANPEEGISGLQSNIAEQLKQRINLDAKGFIGDILGKAEIWAQAVVDGVVEFIGDPVSALKEHFLLAAEHCAKILKNIFTYTMDAVVRVLKESYSIAENLIKQILGAIGFLAEEILRFFTPLKFSDESIQALPSAGAG